MPVARELEEPLDIVGVCRPPAANNEGFAANPERNPATWSGVRPISPQVASAQAADIPRAARKSSTDRGMR